MCLLDEPDSDLRLEDYESRAPYVLGGFFYENYRLDDRYRELTGQSARQTALSIPKGLDGDFPLSDRFVFVAANYLASILVCDSDSELSDKLLKIYDSSMQKIMDEFKKSENETDSGNGGSVDTDGETVARGKSHSIVNVYGSIT